MADVTIENVGGFTIVRGSTFTYKDHLKNLGLRWDWMQRHWYTPDTSRAMNQRLCALFGINAAAGSSDSGGAVVQQAAVPSRISFSSHHQRTATGPSKRRRPTPMNNSHQEPTSVRVHFDDGGDSEEDYPVQHRVKRIQPPYHNRDGDDDHRPPPLRNRPPPPQRVYEELFTDQTPCVQLEVYSDCYE